MGFKYASCSENQNKKKEIGFWCTDRGDTASVMKIAKKCNGVTEADHGIGVTEYNGNAMFIGNGYNGQQDFDNSGNTSPSTASYSLNLWVK